MTVPEQDQNIPTAQADTDGAGCAAAVVLPCPTPAAWTTAPLEQLFQKVERAKQEWEATVDSLSELICLVDDNCRIQRANRTVEAWGLGRVTDVQGLDLHELLHSNCTALFCSLDRFLRQAARMAGQGRPAEIEAYDPILGRHLLLTVRPIASQGKTVPSTAVVVMQDISERRRAEQALQRHTERLEVLNKIQKAILGAGSPEEIAQAALSRIRQLVPFRQARVTLFQPELNGFSILAADANGETHLRPARSFPALAFYRSEERRPDKPFIIRDLAALSDLCEVERQLLIEGIRAYISTPLLAEGEFIGSFSLGSDIPGALGPEHIQIVDEIGDLLAIATRQAQLTRKLAQANSELQEAVQAKDQMIQNVSHELRTPLGLIYGYAELLEDGSLGTLMPDQEKAAQIILQQGDRLRFMVDRLLVLQSFNGDRLQKQHVYLDGWLPAVLRPWIAWAQRDGITVQIEMGSPGGLPPVMADLNYMTHVTDNLLDNAIKFTPRGGQIQVRAWAEPKEVLIAVQDNGAGIPPQKLEQIFEHFYQVDGSATRRFGGMGIGLALCRAIVEAHGGRIWAKSAGSGLGSAFYLALPVCSSFT